MVMTMTLILIDHDSMMGSCLTTHSQSHTLTFHHLRTLVTSDDSEGSDDGDDIWQQWWYIISDISDDNVASDDHNDNWLLGWVFKFFSSCLWSERKLIMIMKMRLCSKNICAARGGWVENNWSVTPTPPIAPALPRVHTTTITTTTTTNNNNNNNWNHHHQHQQQPTLPSQ